MNGVSKVVDITAIREFSKRCLGADVSGHDFLHADQVARLAVDLYLQDQGQIQVEDRAAIEAAAYLHDTIDDKVVADVEGQLVRVKQLLSQSGLKGDQQDLVVDTILHLSYSANLREHYQLTDLGQYVQDADRLEALGAIGIARTFAYGGKVGHPMYDPDLPPVSLQNKDQYRSHKTTTINHFYEKLLKLAGQMNTPAGRQEGQRRTAFMETFLVEFQKETGALSDPAFRIQ
ncbi:HD domain-containing protein [Fructobacillus ficulneus]|uniref:HD domain protein n=1 Tax=Fructobacillus ficulneus TaxID=157463 RepID=A0A0K8MH18_9LACO|nr:HD domain-containing protein [Fructobacillus ficulneus]GAO99453.1 HD domain protein [Fructobacillus ficulneus]